MSMNVVLLKAGCRFLVFVLLFPLFISPDQAGRQALLRPMSGITDTPVLILCVSSLKILLAIATLGFHFLY